MLERLCESHFVLICTVLVGALMAMGSGIGLGKLLRPLVNKLLGNITVNMGENPMAERRHRNHDSCESGNTPESCPEHKRVDAFMVQTEKDRTELFRKVNRIDRNFAKMTVMVEMLLKQRGLEVDFSKVDLRLEEEGE